MFGLLVVEGVEGGGMTGGWLDRVGDGDAGLAPVV
jgi:hypothetical protein